MKAPINSPELNEAYTVIKSIKAILTKMSDELDAEESDNALALYGLITLSDHAIKNQEAAIRNLSNIK